MTAASRTNGADQPRKTLASQIDRLDGILAGLDAALASVVQEAVSTAVKQAVQSVLTEVLTNRELHEQLRQAAQSADSEEKGSMAGGRMSRLYSAAKATVQRAVQTVWRAGRGVGVALLAAGGMIASGLYAARKPIAAAAACAYRHGKAAVVKVGAFLGRLLPLPSFGFGT